ncbi:MAG: hypothetical protein IJ666_00195 [Ruminococcus sp.]|nr:hypothetical protein [Ruminococcus sp.]
MKKFLSVSCACAMVAGLTACGASLEEKIVGTWVYDNKESTVSTDAYRLTFFEGGSCANSGENGTWSISGSTISVLGTYGGQFFKHDTVFGECKIDGDKLIVSNPAVDGSVRNGEIVYTRKENN